MRQTLVARDGNNADWQHDLSVSWDKIGDTKFAEHDLPGAIEAYAASLAIRERLVAVNAGNGQWQRDLIASHVKLARAGDDPRGHFTKALQTAEAVVGSGMVEASVPDLLRAQLAKLK